MKLLGRSSRFWDSELLRFAFLFWFEVLRFATREPSTQSPEPDPSSQKTMSLESVKTELCQTVG